MEKKYEKELYIYVYIYVTKSFCCTAEIKHNIINQLYNEIIFLKKEKKIIIAKSLKLSYPQIFTYINFTQFI